MRNSRDGISLYMRVASPRNRDDELQFAAGGRGTDFNFEQSTAFGAARTSNSRHSRRHGLHFAAGGRLELLSIACARMYRLILPVAFIWQSASSYVGLSLYMRVAIPRNSHDGLAGGHHCIQTDYAAEVEVERK